jgi:hypothetical protein
MGPATWRLEKPRCLESGKNRARCAVHYRMGRTEISNGILKPPVLIHSGRAVFVFRHPMWVHPAVAFRDLLRR